MKRILTIPKDLGIEEVWYDEDEDTMVLNHTQDVEPLLDANKAEYCTDQRYQSEVANKVASLPMSVVLKWKREGLDIFQNDPETKRKIAQKLNSNEYRYLRTRPGKI